LRGERSFGERKGIAGENLPRRLAWTGFGFGLGQGDIKAIDISRLDIADQNRLRNLHMGRTEVSFSDPASVARADFRYAYYNSKEGHHAMAAEGHH
jgi:hypothetical protein